jgi:hypothetical protein
MEAPNGFNMNNPGVRRLLRELRDLEREPSDQYEAHPLEVSNSPRSHADDKY